MAQHFAYMKVNSHCCNEHAYYWFVTCLLAVPQIYCGDLECEIYCAYNKNQNLFIFIVMDFCDSESHYAFDNCQRSSLRIQGHVGVLLCHTW